MRTIQFRAFLKSNQKMYDVLTLDIIDQKALIDNEKENLRGYEKLSEIELMQYTGIRDKNGKKIFERDILRNTRNNKVYNVVWNGSHASFEFVNCEDRYQSMLSANKSYGSYEVIGNIYENRELWEVENE